MFVFFWIVHLCFPCFLITVFLSSIVLVVLHVTCLCFVIAFVFLRCFVFFFSSCFLLFVPYCYYFSMFFIDFVFGCSVLVFLRWIIRYILLSNVCACVYLFFSYSDLLKIVTRVEIWGLLFRYSPRYYSSFSIVTLRGISLLCCVCGSPTHS